MLSNQSGGHRQNAVLYRELYPLCSNATLSLRLFHIYAFSDSAYFIFHNQDTEGAAPWPQLCCHTGHTAHSENTYIRFNSDSELKAPGRIEVMALRYRYLLDNKHKYTSDGSLVDQTCHCPVSPRFAHTSFSKLDGLVLSILFYTNSPLHSVTKSRADAHHRAPCPLYFSIELFDFAVIWVYHLASSMLFLPKPLYSALWTIRKVRTRHPPQCL